VTGPDDKPDRGPVENSGDERPSADAQRPDGMPVGRPFPKGVSGNPGGRPKVVVEVKRILEDAAPKAATKIGQLIDHEDPKIAIAAAKDVIDRLMGKPRSSEDEQQRSTLAAFFAGMMSRMDAAQAQAAADEAEDGEDA
jgi:hypothetical protein